MAERIEKIIPVLSGSQAAKAFEEYPELVRCRDCKYGEQDSGWFTPDGRLWCMRPDGDGDYMRFEVELDGFCAWGERRGRWSTACS